MLFKSYTVKCTKLWVRIAKIHRIYLVVCGGLLLFFSNVFIQGLLDTFSSWVILVDSDIKGLISCKELKLCLLYICVLWFSEISTITRIYWCFYGLPIFHDREGSRERGRQRCWSGGNRSWSEAQSITGQQTPWYRPGLSEWGWWAGEDNQPEPDKGEPHSRALLFDLVSTAKSKIITSHLTTNRLRIYGKLF